MSVHLKPEDDLRGFFTHLMLTLAETELGSLADSYDSIGAALADGALLGREAGDLVADDVSAQCNN